VNEQARLKLRELLAVRSKELCADPHLCEELLSRYCPDCPQEVILLIHALNQGVANDLLAAAEDKPWTEVSAPLVKRLTQDRVMGIEDARWVVETWAQALEKKTNEPYPPLEKTPTPKMPADTALLRSGLQAKTPGPMLRGIWHLIFVAFAGTLGGTTAGARAILFFSAAEQETEEDMAELQQVQQGPMILGQRPDKKSKAKPVRALEKTDSDPLVEAVWGAIFGALGGAIGGIVGWILGGARSWTYSAFGGTILGKLLGACLGAFGGSAAGAWSGFFFGGMGGLFLGAIFGAFVASWIGAILGEYLWLFWL